MKMIGGFHVVYVRDYDVPLVGSWLQALSDARIRTRKTLEGINPWDSIVTYMRHEHHLLIGEPTAEKAYQTIGKSDPQQPRTTIVKGRNLDTGRPAQVEISSLQMQASYNEQASIPYLDWSAKENGKTIGGLLYSIASHEANWFFGGVLHQTLPDDVWELFPRTEADIPAFIHGKPASEYWNRLDLIRSYLSDTYSKMTISEFTERRSSANSSCSADWVLHECCQFEAEARAQMKTLYAAAKEALDPKAE